MGHYSLVVAYSHIFSYTGFLSNTSVFRGRKAQGSFPIRHNIRMLEDWTICSAITALLVKYDLRLGGGSGLFYEVIIFLSILRHLSCTGFVKH